MNQKLFTYLVLSLLWVDFTNSMDHKAEAGNNKQSEKPSIDIWDQFSSDSESDTDGSRPAAAYSAVIKKKNKQAKKDIATAVADIKADEILNAKNKQEKCALPVGVKYLLVDKIKFNLETDYMGTLSQDVIATMRFVKNPNQFPNITLMPLLLYGPPGTGKTSIAQGIARESNRNLIVTTGSSFITAYQGSGAAAVRNLFEFAKSKVKEDKKSVVLFIDEIDAIAGDRSNEQNAERKNTLIELITQLNDLLEEKETTIYVITATNFEKQLDAAFKSRVQSIKIDLPTDEQRRAMLLKWLPQNQTIQNNQLITYLIRETNGFSGRDINWLISQVILLNGNIVLSEQHFASKIREKRVDIDIAKETIDQQKARAIYEKLQMKLALAQLERVQAETSHREMQNIGMVVNIFEHGLQLYQGRSTSSSNCIIS
jgi:DNA replication protein DnaC